MRRVIPLILILVLSFSCKHKSPKGVKKERIINIPIILDKSIQARLEYLFMPEVEYIILESKEIAIRDISKLILTEDNIYILDQRQNYVTHFNRKGELQNRYAGDIFDKTVKFTDINLKDDTLEILSDQRSIFAYTNNGELVKHTSIPIQAKSFNYLRSNRYLYSGYDHLKQSNPFRLQLSSPVNKKYLKTPDDYSLPQISNLNKNFVKIKNYLHFNEPLNDTIYRIIGNKVSPIYYINFFDNKIPREILTWKDTAKVKEELKSGSYPEITSYFENSRYLVFRFMHDKDAYTYLRNKLTGKSILANSFKNDLNYFPFGTPIGLTEDNKLIMKVRAWEINGRTEYLYRKDVQDSPFLREYFELADHIYGYSNPVLFLYELKF